MTRILGFPRLQPHKAGLAAWNPRMNYTRFITAASAARKPSAIRVMSESGPCSPTGGGGPRRAAPGGLCPALRRPGTEGALERARVWAISSRERAGRCGHVLLRLQRALPGTGVGVRLSVRASAEWGGRVRRRERGARGAGHGRAEWKPVFCYCDPWLVRLITPPS